MNNRERVLGICKQQSTALTATEMQKRIADGGHQVRLSSLSSLLKKMVDNGELKRIENVGPRGGYGYALGTTDDN